MGLAPWAASQGSLGAIAGVVTGADTTQTLGGARLALIGTQFIAVSGANGRFRLADVPPGTYRLRVISLGFAPRTVEDVVVTAGTVTTVNINLAMQSTPLDAVVVTGYGVTARRDLTGAITSVGEQDLASKAAPPLALSNALQGRAAGVLVTTNSGVPGAGASVRVRGTNSITANSEPLYVIDGIPSAQGTRSSDPTLNPLNSIDPTQVESIHILKDAAATAIYGARGANGVIMVTTKQGQIGESRTVIETSIGTQTISKRLGVLNARQYMQLRNEANTNVGATAPYPQARIDTTSSFDYPSMLIDRAPQYSHSITFTSGDRDTRLLISGSAMAQRGILTNSDFQRQGTRLNLTRQVREGFHLGTNLSVVRSEQGLNATEAGGLGASTNGILAAMNFDPSLPPRRSDGSWNLLTNLGEQLQNPVANALEIQNPKRLYRLLGSGFSEFAPTHSLEFRSTVGTNIVLERTPSYLPRTSPAGASNQGIASVYSSHGVELTNENTVTYRPLLRGAHDLTLLGGASIQRSDFEDQYSEARGFPDDHFSYNNLGAGTTRSGIGSSATRSTLLSFLGRATYDFRDRYTLTLATRRDGSSRFAVNNKWAFFPSLAFAWRAIDESFIRNRVPLSNLKFRVSYGVVGNQAISNYQSLAQLTPLFVPIGAGTEVVAMAPFGGEGNPNLKWETQQQLNAGVDLGFLNNRVLLTLDAYQTRTSDLLLAVPVPRSSGYSSQLQNVGSVRNRGIELSVSLLNAQHERFSWQTSVNVAANRNVVLDLGGRTFIEPSGDRYSRFLGQMSAHRILVGEPVGAFYGFKVNGIFQAGDICPLKTPRPQLDCVPGEYNIRDANGDGVITTSDRVVLGNAQPSFFGGLTNTVVLGRWTFDAAIAFSQGNKVANVARAWTELATAFLNESDRVLNRWTPSNTTTTVPRANNQRPRWLYSTLVEDGSYLRLQNVTVGFQLPTRLMPVREARLYVTGRNVLLLTRYTGFDPEVNSLGGDPAEPGVDVGAYPRARSWNVGLNVVF